MSTRDINSEISRRFDELTRRLDQLEDRLPTLPSRALGLGRATAQRVNATAGAIAHDVGRQLGQFGSTADDALATSAGQARSAVERTSATASRTTNEAVGQARAQAKRTGRAAERAATALLDDATRAVEPDGDGRPAAFENWTKDELYERAQELDIDGRSSMSKRELVRALRSA